MRGLTEELHRTIATTAASSDPGDMEGANGKGTVDALMSCAAYGTVLNVWTNPLEGQMMHVMITKGDVSLLPVSDGCVHNTLFAIYRLRRDSGTHLVDGQVRLYLCCV